MTGLLAQISPRLVPQTSPGAATPPDFTSAAAAAAHSPVAANPAHGLFQDAATRLDVFHGYIWVLVIAFVVTLCATPLMRRFAVANGIIDRPSDPRKVHKFPIAYLGGVAVFLGIMAGIFYSYLGVKFPELLDFRASPNGAGAVVYEDVPFSILLGMLAIALVGLIDDIYGTLPHVKIGGQLVAAAALAYTDVGVKVAAGLVIPAAKALGITTTTIAGFETVLLNIPLPFVIAGGDHISIDIIYWIGTAIIGFFVIGACNSSNLIDGLDGLLTGVTAIAVAGLLIISLGMMVAKDGGEFGGRDAQRVVLCMAVLGACLGFLPHNFNPATIFLGDCGSLLLGFCTIVIVLTLGDTGKTHFVVAGLVIYSIPLIDTILAIVRRKMAGKSISSADDQHLHHMLKRALGVKGAVFSLYGIGFAFAGLGLAMSLTRARVIYALALVAVAYIAVIAIKIARKKQIEEQAGAYDAAKSAALAIPGEPPKGTPLASARLGDQRA
jgi:UDP-GlcNAc:undecaprenyl-phosphate GlcNAc-1-phosphate transferase